VVLDQGEADRYAQWFYDAFDPITHLDAYRRDLAIKFFCGGSDQHVPAEEAKAQYCVGKMYHKGQGAPEDDLQAVAWYREAADQGYAKAQTNLGWMYANGHGLEQDYVRALERRTLSLNQEDFRRR
jgi:TPR repeat protein